MKIKILGSGCSNCKKLDKLVHIALIDMNINADIEKVEDYSEMVKYGILSTPALVINEKIVISGKVPSVGEIVEFITKNN